MKRFLRAFDNFGPINILFVLFIELLKEYPLLVVYTIQYLYREHVFRCETWPNK